MKKLCTVKGIAALLCILFLLSIPFGVIAYNRGNAPEVTAGNFCQRIENRVDFTLTNTEFTLKKTNERTQTYLLTLYLTVKKGEPDIYAVIDNIELTGMDYNYIVFTADGENGEDTNPVGLVLDGNEHRWTVEISLDIKNKGDFLPELEITYQSGLTPDTADGYYLDIPLTVNVG